MNEFAYYPQIHNNRTYGNSNGIIWVQGLDGARSYQLMPNGCALLLDSENEGVFYIKTTDNVGMCNLRTFNYTEVTSTPAPTIDTSQFITREELMEILDKRTSGNGKQSVSTIKLANKNATE